MTPERWRQMKEVRNAALDRAPDLAGHRISHYQIIEKLGEGGMGAVYKARDTHLDRLVAIKVLPREKVGDPDRKRRFVQEAKAASSLNHPNIVSVYDIDQADGIEFIAMECVEGKTLDALIGHKGLKLTEALKYAVEIADALAKAHAAGITHHDLKPGNVMVTAEGRVKVLDFGLAKLTEAAPVSSEDSTLIGQPSTESGMIVGTIGYMSPEQAAGKKVDARSDIFSFGSLLYEMLTGRQAFRGETPALTLAAILHLEPPPLPAEIPRELERVIARCLRKDVARRYQHLDDVKIALEEICDAPEPAQRPARTRRFPIFAVCVGAVALLAIISATSFVTRRLTSRPVVGVVRTTIALPPGTQLTRDLRGPTRTELAVSPVGRHFVFSASTDGSEAKARLYLRAMDQAEALPIPGTEGARAPFFSPDEQWVGFFAGGKLQKVPLSGGIPVPLCDLSEPPMGASWGANGTIVFGRLGRLQHVGDGGGTPQDLTTRDPATEATHRLPFFLPGGKAVLFTVMPNALAARGWIEAVSLDSGQRKVLVDDGMDARYVPTGHLVFLREGTLLAVPFDPERLEVRGSAVAVAGGLLHAINDTHSSRNSGAGQYGFSDWGALVYASGGVFPEREGELFWVDRRGQAEPVKSFGKRPVLFPRISPDGQKLAYVTQGRNAHLWVHDLARGTSSKLTNEGRASEPTWTPDGSRIIFNFSLAGVTNIFWMPWDGSGPVERLTTSKQIQIPASMTPDGRLLAFVEVSPTKGYDIYLLRMDSRQASPIVSTNYADWWPEFSPDGRWLAYGSDESGRLDVYVTPVPGPGRRFPISAEGGREPLWARNGHEIFYWSLDGKKLMVVDTVLQPDFRAAAPRVLFEFQGVGTFPLRGYDISPDGQRFLIPVFPAIKPVEVTQLNLVLNWFEELKRLAPGGKTR